MTRIKTLGKQAKKLSLRPLPFNEAVSDLLKVKPESKKKR